MDDEDLVEVAQDYASRHALEVREILGSGIHGIVYVVESKADPGRRALKLHRDTEAYTREKTVYELLREKRIDTILGFDIPQPLRFDDEFMAIEMTIVMPPFVLDFASASLEVPMEFSEEVWADWEHTKQEQFGLQWEAVQAILTELRRYGIHMLDPSPSNIRFS
jgi:serine kinase of HPr protein (carbohydrate metabolism regulator)